MHQKNIRKNENSAGVCLYAKHCFCLFPVFESGQSGIVLRASAKPVNKSLCHSRHPCCFVPGNTACTKLVYW